MLMAYSFFSIGRIMEEGMENENKIKLPNGLCIRKSCMGNPVCFCCLITRHCYDKLDECNTDCEGHSSLDTEAATTRAMPPPF